MRVRVGARSDIGRARERNEDAYLLRDPLFAVADGMGGHRGGDVASALALEILESGEDSAGDATAAPLAETIKEANRRLLDRAESDRDLRGMGTTLTAVLTDDAKAHVAHVGDSRAYLLRDGNLQQLTEDHTLVQRMVREGRITSQEAGTHPQRSILTRALGVDADFSVDELTLDVHAGDRLLLCTDGLTSMVERDRIREILGGEDDPQVACDRLIDAANRAGGDDNVTVIVLDFIDDEAGEGERVAPPAMTKRREPATPSPKPAPAKEARRPVRWRRVAVWAGVVAALLVAALFGTRLYIDRQWYVGDAGGRVAIYNGIPTEILGFELSHVRVTTELSTAEAEGLQPWTDLSEGITAGSLEEAQRIVDQIRQDLSEPGTQGAVP
jgi:serine/threonine protein phosphatase PrpC